MTFWSLNLRGPTTRSTDDEAETPLEQPGAPWSSTEPHLLQMLFMGAICKPFTTPCISCPAGKIPVTVSSSSRLPRPQAEEH